MHHIRLIFAWGLFSLLLVDDDMRAERGIESERTEQRAELWHCLKARLLSDMTTPYGSLLHAPNYKLWICKNKSWWQGFHAHLVKTYFLGSKTTTTSMFILYALKALIVYKTDFPIRDAHIKKSYSSHLIIVEWWWYWAAILNFKTKLHVFFLTWW